MRPEIRGRPDFSRARNPIARTISGPTEVGPTRQAPGAFIHHPGIHHERPRNFGDAVRVQFADIPVATIDPLDIAAVAVSAFDSSEHHGRSYHLTGPESLLPAERLRILGDALGRPLQVVALSNNEARDEMTKSMPPKYVDAFMSMWADGNHDESRVLPTVEDVIGRPPRTFAQWVAAHADAFA